MDNQNRLSGRSSDRTRVPPIRSFLQQVHLNSQQDFLSREHFENVLQDSQREHLILQLLTG